MRTSVDMGLNWSMKSQFTMHMVMTATHGTHLTVVRWNRGNVLIELVSPDVGRTEAMTQQILWIDIKNVHIVGYLYSVTGCWTGVLEWSTGMEYWNEAKIPAPPHIHLTV